jgi:dTDP-4-amino-4,6-dideoxygalactose transaminase
MTVRFSNLAKVNRLYRDEFLKEFNEILESGRFILGSKLEYFEEQYANFSNASYCIGVGNGLDALYLALIANDIGPGDEVIVPANTFIATWLAVTRCGAKPVPVEPSLDTFNIDVLSVEAKITKRTSAIIAVHLYGQPADMDPLRTIAKKYRLLLVEDNAQAQGALYKGRVTGSLGDIAATSFYPGKNIGALGDGGAITLNNRDLAEKLRKLRNYGSSLKYQHELLGCNSRLDEIQAAFLNVKLRFISRDNELRQRIAAHYLAELQDLPIQLPQTPLWATPVWHLFVIRSKFRDQLRDYLDLRKIETLIHYPTPPHKQPCYRDYSSYSMPRAERLAGEILSLPLFTDMQMDEVSHVCRTIKEFHQAI